MLVALNSGGIACPVTFVIIQLEARKPAVVSEEFGTCPDLVESRAEGGALVLEMPLHVAHPDLWDQQELEEAGRSRMVQTCELGKITETKLVE